MVDVCKSCIYWKESEIGPEEGECRKSSPFMDVSTYRAKWPLTLVDDWCGDYKREEANP